MFDSSASQNDLFAQNQEPMFDSSASQNDLFAQNQEPMFDSSANQNDLFAQNQEPIFDSSASQNDLFAQNQDNFNALNNTPTQNTVFNQELTFNTGATQNNIFTQNQNNYSSLPNTVVQNTMFNQELTFDTGATQNDIFTQNQRNFDLLESMPEQNELSTQKDMLTQNDAPKDNFATTQKQTGFMDLIGETHIKPPKSTDLELDFEDATPKKAEPKTNEKKSESKIIPFGKACILLHFTTQENVDEALQIQRTKSPQKKLGEIMVEQGMIAPDKVKTVLDRQQVRNMLCTKSNKSYKIVLYQASKKYKCKVCSSNLVLEDENTDKIKVNTPKAPTQFIGLTQEIPLQIKHNQQQEPELDFAEDYTPPKNNSESNFDSNNFDNDIHDINVFQPEEHTETILEKVGIDVNQLRDYNDRPHNSYQKSLTDRRIKTIGAIVGVVIVILLLILFPSNHKKPTRGDRQSNKPRSVARPTVSKSSSQPSTKEEQEWELLQAELDHISEESAKLDKDNTNDENVTSAKLLQKWSPLLEDCRKASNDLAQFISRYKGERNNVEIEQVKGKIKKASDICQFHMVASIQATLDHKFDQMSQKMMKFNDQIEESVKIIDDFYSNIVLVYLDIIPNFKNELEDIRSKNYRKIESIALKAVEKLQTEVGSGLDTLSKLSNSKKFDKLNELKKLCEDEKNRQLEQHIGKIDTELQEIEKKIKTYNLYQSFNECASPLYKYIKEQKFDYALKYIKNTLSKTPNINEEICTKLEKEIQEYKKIYNETWRILRNLFDKKEKIEWRYYNGKKISKLTSNIQSVTLTSNSITIGKGTHIYKVSLDQITFDTLTHVYNSYAVEGSDKEIVYCFFYIGKRVEDLDSLYALNTFSDFHNHCLLFYTIQEILLYTDEDPSDENSQKIMNLIKPLDRRWRENIYYQFSAEQLAIQVKKYIQKASHTKNIAELADCYETYLSIFHPSKL